MLNLPKNPNFYKDHVNVILKDVKRLGKSTKQKAKQNHIKYLINNFAQFYEHQIYRLYPFIYQYGVFLPSKDSPGLSSLTEYIYSNTETYDTMLVHFQYQFKSKFVIRYIYTYKNLLKINLTLTLTLVLILNTNINSNPKH